MDDVLTGGCLCGAIRFELAVEGELGLLLNCHCHFCRRAHGAAFVTSAPVATRRLRFVQGESAIARYEARYFCGTCGTRLFNRLESRPELTMLMVSSLDEQPETEPALHVNIESKAPWYVIRDDAPRYDGFPPGTVDEPRGRGDR